MPNVDPAKRAQEILAQYNIQSAPVPVEKIAKSLGAQVRFAPFDDELCGMVHVRDGVPVIGVNALHHPNRQRFTIAHELGHLILHKDLITTQVHVDKGFQVQVPALMRDEKSASGTDDIEIQANAFAAELLMPTQLVEDALRDKTFDIDDEQPLQELAKRFRVSKQAFEFRMRKI